MEERQITIIGTSHIAEESIRKVTEAIASLSPDIVAVELDRRRYHALTTKQKSRFSFYALRRVGFFGFMFGFIGGWASRKLGRVVGVDPGQDMLTAIELAKKQDIRIELIDQDIEITLKRFSRYLTGAERRRFVADIFWGIVRPKKEMEKLGIDTLDLSKIPSEELITKLMAMMQVRYPNVYRVLVHERNVYMARKLNRLASENPGKKIIAVVGAGHKQGMLGLLGEGSEPSYSFTVTLG